MHIGENGLFVGANSTMGNSELKMEKMGDHLNNASNKFHLLKHDYNSLLITGKCAEICTQKQ